MNPYPFASPCGQTTPLFTRRAILREMSCGFGYLAFAGLAAKAAAPLGESPSLNPPQLLPKAKRVIFLCMRGAPSHVDTFDYKPQLMKDSGKAGRRPGTRLLGSPWKFSQHGRSGLWISELFPELAKHADALCLVRSMQTDLPAHPQAMLKLHTGSSQFIRPSLGAWTLYGLGSLNENLPGFVTLTPPSGGGGAQNYGSAFLPARFQATRIGTESRPIAEAEVRNLVSQQPAGNQHTQLDLIQTLNRQKLARESSNPEVEGAIESLELAFKMQSQMPKVLDLSQETDATRSLYGIGRDPTDDFGRKCLLARRLVEAGVRFVEVSHGNWDQHFNLNAGLRANCAATDLPLAGLLSDLQQRGLLEDTLVVWSGEFGRTPHAQGNDGRDHNHQAFTLWMAGGGVRSGQAYGASDEHGYEAVQDRVQIPDLHATLLALLGLDHEKLTFNYAGRDFRLTDVAGSVVRQLIG
jgi:hypothetical protein